MAINFEQPSNEQIRSLRIEELRQLCLDYRDALAKIASGESDDLERWQCDRGCDSIAATALDESAHVGGP